MTPKIRPTTGTVVDIPDADQADLLLPIVKFVDGVFADKTLILGTVIAQLADCLHAFHALHNMRKCPGLHDIKHFADMALDNDTCFGLALMRCGTLNADREEGNPDYEGSEIVRHYRTLAATVKKAVERNRALKMQSLPEFLRVRVCLAIGEALAWSLDGETDERFELDILTVARFMRLMNRKK